MIFVIAFCAGIVLLGILWDTAGSTQISGPVVLFTIGMYSFGMRTIKELKSEIARLQAASGSEE